MARDWSALSPGPCFPLVVIILRANKYKDVQCPRENLEVAVLDPPPSLSEHRRNIILKVFKAQDE